MSVKSNPSFYSYDLSIFNENSTEARKKSAHLPVILKSNKSKQSASSAGSISSYSSQLTTPQIPTSTVNIKRKLLDGFVLLQASGMSLPDDARQIILSGKGFTDVEKADLAFFNGLIYLDVNENYLDVTSFAALPKLKELRIACNFISNIDFTGLQLNNLEAPFPKLQYLDLSYNDLNIESVEALSVLPFLRELDLCGNGLGYLPSEMFRFQSLEKLLLEHNKFEDNDIFVILSVVPCLRMVSVAYNFLSEIPVDACRDEDSFRLLELLDLSYNYFSHEASLAPCLRLLRLDQLMLYGNPVLGPTGEDPLGTYVEELIEAAADARDGFTKKPLEILTEVPKKRRRGKYEQLGRQAYYRDFAIKKVQERPMFTQRRENYGEPTKTLFEAAMDVARNDRGGTRSLGSQSQTRTQTGSGKHATDPNELVPIPADLTFITNAGALQTETQFGHWRSQEEGGEEEVPGEEGLRSQSASARIAPTGRATDASLPERLFGLSLADTDTRGQPPVALTTAIKALRYALKHPMTDYNDSSLSGIHGNHSYTRTNKLTELRRRPRMTYAEKKTRLPITHLKPANNDRASTLNTLHQLEEVLDGLNLNTGQEVLGAKLRSAYGSEDVGGGHGLREGAYRPDTGIKKLVMMVKEVVQDTQL